MTPEEVLVASRRMETREQVIAFDEAITEAGALGTSRLDLRRLLEAFDDGTAHAEVMFGLVHVIDAFDEVALIRELVASGASMRERAPDWLRVLLTRCLNHRPTCGELERVIRREPEACLAVRAAVEELARNPTPVGERARQLLLPT